MALKGQKRRFAEAIVSAKPLKISNKEAALQIGCTETSASASGSRCAADPEVRAYIVAHWPDYFDPLASLPASQTQAAVPQTELPLFCAREIAVWLRERADDEDLRHIAAALREVLPEDADEASVIAAVRRADKESGMFQNFVKAVCDKLKTSTDPLDFWDGILLDPFATLKDKQTAAAEKAKYTKSKPAALTQKEMQKEKARAEREARRQQNAVGDFFGFAETRPNPDPPAYQGNVPVWN